MLTENNATTYFDLMPHLTGEKSILPKIEPALDNIPDSYVKEAVNWAIKNGILKGDEKGNLMLHNNVTRQDCLVLLIEQGGNKSRSIKAPA